MDVNRWVDERLAALDPPADWRPDSAAALAQLRRRDAPTRRRWWLWATVSASAAAACAILLLVSTPAACANPLGCKQSPQSAPARPAPVAAASSGPVANTPVANTPVANTPGVNRGAANPMAATRPAKPDTQPDFKESGSRTAPVTCQLYTDFECPHCAAFYLETMPQFAARYVDTGKVRLIHRDFPLARHRYARLAALYADAAGETGYYQAVANRLFRTQAVWSADGDIDGQVARVVPPAAMEKVRALARDSAAAESSVAADEAQARENHVDRTPTLLCNGQIIGPNLSFGTIEASIDPLLAQR
jgi:protein-disulfide isomerase